MNPNEHCIFCKIVAGVISAEHVYEDDEFIAFLDINPRGPGHTQVIPRAHHRFVWDVPHIEQYFRIVRDIALAQRAAFGIKLIRSQVYGDEVPHAHVWVWPDTQTGKADIAKNAARLREQLAAMQPR